MKLRILGNNIRIRLSQSELETFENTGAVEMVIDFGNGQLTYVIKKDPLVQDVVAGYEDNIIKVSIPENIASQWLKDEEVGFENTDQSKIRILVEKDFQCLHKRPNEDESDSFPNPLA